jgi:hypothetical protein
MNLIPRFFLVWRWRLWKGIGASLYVRPLRLLKGVLDAMMRH